MAQLAWTWLVLTSRGSTTSWAGTLIGWYLFTIFIIIITRDNDWDEIWIINNKSSFSNKSKNHQTLKMIFRWESEPKRDMWGSTGLPIQGHHHDTLSLLIIVIIICYNHQHHPYPRNHHLLQPAAVGSKEPFYQPASFRDGRKVFMLMKVNDQWWQWSLSDHSVLGQRGILWRGWRLGETPILSTWGESTDPPSFIIEMIFIVAHNLYGRTWNLRSTTGTVMERLTGATLSCDPTTGTNRYVALSKMM